MTTSWTREQKIFYENYYLVLSDLTRNVYKDNVTTKEELRTRAWDDTSNPTYMSQAVKKTCSILGWEVVTLSQLKAKMGIY
jgi:hypothetical protein